MVLRGAPAVTGSAQPEAATASTTIPTRKAPIFFIPLRLFGRPVGSLKAHRLASSTGNSHSDAVPLGNLDESLEGRILREQRGHVASKRVVGRTDGHLHDAGLTLGDPDRVRHSRGQELHGPRTSSHGFRFPDPELGLALDDDLYLVPGWLCAGGHPRSVSR